MEQTPKASIETFRGTVNVMFSDAMIASTRDALLLREEGKEPVFFVPFRDIYFTFLRESQTESRSPETGRARYWGAQAVGEAAADVMWAYDAPQPHLAGLRQHGAFDPSKVRIEAVPQEDLLHTPHVP